MSVDPSSDTAPRAPAGSRADYPLTHLHRLSLRTVADRCGVHPDLVRRYAALSLLNASRDAAGRLWFDPDAPVVIARIQRLHAGLPLNYAAIGLVLDLLDRVNQLEAALRCRGFVPPPVEARRRSPWI